MRRPSDQERGMVLLGTLFVWGVVSVYTGAMLSRGLSELHFAERAVGVAQAFYLAEAGTAGGLAELRTRVETELNQRLVGLDDGTVLADYLSPRGGVEFLRDYAADPAGVPWTLDLASNPPRALVTVTLENAEVGNYEAQVDVTVAPAGPTRPEWDVYVFPYTYRIVSLGRATGFQAERTVRIARPFTITIRRDNFARYALFTNVHQAPGGSLVWFTDRTNFRGPVHTNDRFSFALNPSGSFANEVTQVRTTARFYNSGSPVLLDEDRNGDRDVPVFQAGFARGAAAVPLPLAVDGDYQRRAALGLADDAVVPAVAPGVHVPSAGGMVVGGVYVQGDAGLTVGQDADGRPQVEIRQGADLTTIITDRATSRTIVRGAAGDEVFAGLTRGLVFVNDGRVTALQGEVEGETRLTIAAEGDLLIAGHLTYEDLASSSPPSAMGTTNVLGLMSWSGNVRIVTSCPDDIQVHATIMTPVGVCTVDNFSSGAPRGTATILGGVIQNQYGPFGTFSGGVQRSGYGRNFVYDERMSQGTNPPYFPTVGRFAASEAGLHAAPAWESGE